MNTLMGYGAGNLIHVPPFPKNEISMKAFQEEFWGNCLTFSLDFLENWDNTPHSPRIAQTPIMSRAGMIRGFLKPNFLRSRTR